MSSNCAAVIPGGSAKKACFLDRPTNLIFFKKDIVFNNIADAKNTETWRAMIQEALSAYPTLAINGVTSTKPAIRKESLGNGAQVSTGIDAGMVVVNLNTNACDFKELLDSMQGDEYQVAIGLGTNKVMFYEKLNGELMGFTGQCTAIPIGMPAFDNKTQEFQVDINWQDVDQFNHYRIVQLPIFVKELVDYCPVGLDVSVDTPLDHEDLILKVIERCSYPEVVVTDTLTAEFEDKSDSAITCTPAAGSGVYTCTVNKGLATPLVASDYAWARLVKKTASVYDKISNKFLIRVWPTT